MNTKDKGNIGEAAVIKDLLDKNYCILLPFGDNEEFDIVAYKDDLFIKIQVKYAEAKEGKVEFKCCRTVYNNNGHNIDTPYINIDYFAGYCPTIDKVFYFENINKSSFTIRLNPTKNGQKVGINWWEDYITMGD